MVSGPLNAIEQPLALRPRPQVTIFLGPPIAWRPFWPLDRTKPGVYPYLATLQPQVAELAGAGASSRARCAEAEVRSARAIKPYLRAWCHYLDNDPFNSLVEFEALATSGITAEVRTAALRDALQLAAELLDPNTALKRFRTDDELDRIAAEYARAGRTRESMTLLSAIGGSGERGCEHALSGLRLDPSDVDRKLRITKLMAEARTNGWTNCASGAAALDCEEALAGSPPQPASCVQVEENHDRERYILSRVLEDWDVAERRPALWLDWAAHASSCSNIEGWDQVVRDALFNALAVARCNTDVLGEAQRIFSNDLQRPGTDELSGTHPATLPGGT